MMFMPIVPAGHQSVVKRTRRIACDLTGESKQLCSRVQRLEYAG